MAVKNLKRIRARSRVRRALLREMPDGSEKGQYAPLLGIALGTYLVFWSLGQFVDRRWHYASILPTSILAVETLRAFGVDIPGRASRRIESARRRVAMAARRVSRQAQKMIGAERETAAAAR